MGWIGPLPNGLSSMADINGGDANRLLYNWDDPPRNHSLNNSPTKLRI